MICSNFSELLALISRRGAGLIAIDGCPQVGKTTLARQLAATTQGRCVDFDAFLNKGTGAFVAALRLDELSSVVSHAIDQSSPVFLSSVCMREVLNRIDIQPQLHIYVELKSQEGVTQNLDIIDCETDTSSLQALDGDLEHELGSYHAKHKPRLSADFVFERVEPDVPDGVNSYAPN